MNLGTMTVILEANARALVQAEASIRRLQQQVAQSSSAMQSKLDAVNMNKGSKNITDTLNNVSHQLRSFGWLASTVLTAPIVMLGKASIKMGMDFEFTLKKMVGLAGLTADQIDMVGESIKKLSTATGQGPQELVDAFYFVKSSGFDVAQAMNITEMSAKGAASGMGDTKDMANLLTAAMTAYSKEGLTAGKAMDIFTKTIKEGKGEPAEMVRAFGTFLPMAQKLGLDLAEMGGAFATLTLVTNSSATAATYLRNVLAKLIDPSEEVRKAFNSMETSVEQVQTMLKNQGFAATMKALDAITAKYGKTIDSIFPEMRSMLGALNLTGDGMKRLERITASVDDNMNAFQKHFEFMSTTMRMTWNKALVEGKNALIEFGAVAAKAVTPALESLMKRVSRLVEWFKSLSDEQQRSLLKVLAWTAAIGPLSLAISVLGTAIVSISKAYSTLMAISSRLFLANPWLAVATAILTAIAYVLTFKKRTEEIVSATKELVNTWAEGDALLVDYKEVEGRQAIIEKMNKRQLSSYKMLLETKLAMEEDYIFKSKALTLNSIGEDDTTKAWRKQIEEREKAGDTVMVSILQKRIESRKQVLMQERDIEVKNAEERLNNYKKFYEQVMLLWKKMGLDTEGSGLGGLPIDEELNTAFKRLEKLLAKYKAGMPQDSVSFLPDFSKLFEARRGDSIGFMQDFQTELDLIALKSKTLGEQFDTSRAQLSYFKDTLNKMWDAGMRPGQDPLMDEMVKNMQKLTTATQWADIAISTLSNAFTSLFDSILNGGKDMASALVSIIKSMVSQIASELARIAITKAIMAIVTKGASVALPSITMAKGGTVPGGYPNDTYPALLSSGETVLPKSIENLRLQPAQFDGQVVFRIGQNELVGVLAKAEKKNNIF